MNMVDLIAKKRRGEFHLPEEIFFIINGFNKGIIPDYQISAWLMAACLNGMNFEESLAMTQAMVNSGKILDLSDIGNYIIDKHSTGGVGDKTTLVLMPLLAAAGLPIAKLSGRGLGHTGGTIDKLESIPGFRTALELDEFLCQVKKIGAAIASQTSHLTPVEGKIYALRDVTATVESIPLIAASILSKKIAAGANIIILDVKYGSGAFMKSLNEAQKLSKTMTEIGKKLNKITVAVITSMEQPLGNTVGNSLEVIEAIQTLKNQGPEDLKELCLYLGSIAMIKSNRADNMDTAKNILNRHLEDGSALVKFKEIIKAQGGNPEIINNPKKLPVSKYMIELKSNKDGYIEKLEAFTVAKACKLLGAGRDKKGDKINYSVGIILNKKIGDKVQKDEILAKIFADSSELAKESINLVSQAYEISDNMPKKPVLIHQML
ncbi:MAG: thymidine phosphorylase [bacterium]